MAGSDTLLHPPARMAAVMTGQKWTAVLKPETDSRLEIQYIARDSKL